MHFTGSISLSTVSAIFIIFNNFGLRAPTNPLILTLKWRNFNLGPFQLFGLPSVRGSTTVIAAAADRFREQPSWRFVHADVAEAHASRPAWLPRADLVLCRDLFFHLPNAKVAAALRNFKRSGATWLLATHNAHHAGPNAARAQWQAGGAGMPTWYTGDLDQGGYRPVNLRLPPFELPAPEWQWVDWRHPSSRAWDKVLAMWRLEALDV